MYAIRKPCWCKTNKNLFGVPKIYKVIKVEDGGILLENIGMWDLDKFLVVKTKKEANNVLKLIKELQNEKNYFSTAYYRNGR